MSKTYLMVGAEGEHEYPIHVDEYGNLFVNLPNIAGENRINLDGSFLSVKEAHEMTVVPLTTTGDIDITSGAPGILHKVICLSDITGSPDIDFDNGTTLKFDLPQAMTALQEINFGGVIFNDGIIVDRTLAASAGVIIVVWSLL